MNCSVCNQNTTPVRVGTSEYCSVCGARLTEVRQPAQAAAGRGHTLDLRAARPAAALHDGPRSASRVLDLRGSTLKPAPARPDSAAVVHPTAVAHPAAVIQARHEPAAPPPKTAAKEHHFARFEDRFERAKQTPRSEHVSKFGGHLPGSHAADAHPTGPEPARAAAPPIHTVHPGEVHLPALPPAVATAHEAMTRLVPAMSAAPATHHAAPAAGPHFSLPRLSRGQIAASAAAITIMGGYIWLQNYPKLAIQSAAGRSGLAASLPSYLPSSYSLATTDASPGLVTFHFNTPSQTGALTITQSRTTWDSSTLLDDFVAKQSNDYSAIEGQGLTIYLYGQNQAAWVNHGIRYSIEGATRLSREQILKIAYSL